MDLRHTKDPAEFTKIVAEYGKTRPPGVWLTDGAWDHEQQPLAGEVPAHP